MATYTQKQRILSFETVLGPDDLLVRSFSGWESISKPFFFELELMSENDAIDLDKLMGTKASLRIALADGTPRYWSGHISRMTQSWRGPVFTSYRAELVPWLWFLGLNRSSRIFQDKKTADILGEVFTSLNFKDFDFRLDGTFPKREYCVQYRETDLNFVMRLMEEEGFFYFFEHEKDRHVLVIANKPVAHPICESQSSVHCRNGAGGRLDEDFIHEWRQQKQYVSSGSALVDFNFKTPTKELGVHLNGDNPLEIYDQPGNYLDKSAGEALNRIRLEEIQAAATAADGEGNCRVFTAGHRFKLRDHYRPELNTWYVLTEVRHYATQAGNFMGDEAAGGGEESYRNDFICIPYKIPFRPARHTPVPFVEGCQTAIVVGPKGEEIYTDEFGRVKVQFHWDREGQRDEKSSCWIRVAQTLAGTGWGTVAIPRIGQEVVVEFLEGSPDRPLITGCVYNGQMKPPYDLPANRSRIGIKSRSTKGGASTNFNEIRFEDKKGAELFLMHAERNMEMAVERDARVLIEGNSHTSIKGEERRNTEGDLSVQVSGERHERISSLLTVESGQEIHLKGGVKIVIEAGMQVTLRGPNGFIDIGPAGVVIQGTTVLINSGGGAGATGTAANPKDSELPKESP